VIRSYFFQHAEVAHLLCERLRLSRFP